MLGRSKLWGVRRLAKWSGSCRRNSMWQSSSSWKWRAYQKLQAPPIPNVSFILWPFSSHTEIQGLCMCAYCAFTSHGSPTQCRHDWEGRKGLVVLQRVKRHSSRAVSMLVAKRIQILCWQIYCGVSWQERYHHCHTRRRQRRGEAWPHSSLWDMMFGGWCCSGMGTGTAT